MLDIWSLILFRHNAVSLFLASTLNSHLFQVHGLVDWYKAKSRCAKAFWLILIFFFLGVLIYGVCTSVKEYYTNPIATTISITPNTSLEFPEVLVCPTSYLDFSGMGIRWNVFFLFPKPLSLFSFYISNFFLWASIRLFRLFLVVFSCPVYVVATTPREGSILRRRFCQSVVRV